MYSLSYKVSKPVEENMRFGKSNVIPTYSSTATSYVSPKNKQTNKNRTKKSSIYVCGLSIEVDGTSALSKEGGFCPYEVLP